MMRGSTKTGRLSQKSKANFDSMPAGEDDFEIDANGEIIETKKKQKKKVDAIEAAFATYTAEDRKAMENKMSRKSMVGGLRAAYKQDGQRQSKSDKILGGQAAPNVAQVGAGSDGKKLFESRKEDESMRAFNRRIKQETAQVLSASMKKAQTSERKKGYLKERKKAKALKKKGQKRGRGDSDSEEEGQGWLEKEDAFGVQAERPPEFKVVPKDRRRKEVAASTKGEDEEQDENEAFRQKQEKKKKMEMEALSKKVQEAYKLMKAKKHAAN